MKILLVEDNEYQREKFHNRLVENCHDVTLAENGKGALNFLEEHTFDAVITDMQMPIMSGRHLLQAMAWNDLTPPTLLHSSEEIAYEDGDRWELSEVVEYFDFAQFHIKSRSSLQYIDDFLERITANS